jgi:chromosome segregation ATPase
MKTRIAFVLALLVCAALGIGLYVTGDKAAKEKSADNEHMANLTNQLVSTRQNLDDEKQKSLALQEDLKKQADALAEATNAFARAKEKMEAKLEATIKQSEAELKASQQKVAERDSRIAELEAQNQTLDLHADELSTAITNLNNQIADTRQQLAAAKGDNAFLTSQLNRLIAEKSELERQFNDLSVLRAQVAKLREQQAIARRLDMMRRGVYANIGKKGGEILMELSKTNGAAGQRPAYDLNVEVSADGSLKVIPPITDHGAGTNSPNRR